MALNNYKRITFEDMVEYIENNAPKDKAWFKSVAIIKDKNGTMRYNHLVAKKAFCEKYMPELLPVKADKKVNKTDILNEW